MGSVYLVCAVVGGMLVVVSALGDAVPATDSHLEPSDVGEAAGPGHAVTWLPFLSLRFWTYALAAFGVTGLLLTRLAELGAFSGALVAAATGLTAGTGISYATRWLLERQTQSLVRASDLLVGRVLVAIEGGKPGKVRFEVGGEIIDILAVGRDPELLAVGSEVVVLEHDRAEALVADKNRVFSRLDARLEDRARGQQERAKAPDGAPRLGS